MDNMKNEMRNGAEHDFDRVVSMLSPRFVRRMPDSLGGAPQSKKTLSAVIWTFGSAAAVLAVIIVLAVRASTTAFATSVPASEIVMRALETGARSGSCKVEFTWRGFETSDEEIYTPHPDAPSVSATLYILCDSSGGGCRIDWHDADRNSIIYDGTDYIRLKDGVQVARHPSRFGSELGIFLNMETLTRSLGEIPADEFTEKDGVITVNHRSCDVIFRGEFSREDRRLIKASILGTAADGRSVTVMETSSVIFGADVQPSLFLR